MEDIQRRYNRSITGVITAILWPSCEGKAECAQPHSCVQLSVTPGTVAHPAPLPMGFPRQEYWSGLLFPSPGGSSWPRDQNCVFYISCISGRVLHHQATWESPKAKHWNTINFFKTITHTYTFLKKPWICISKCPLYSNKTVHL